ncbi:MAG: Flp family type IVb pilin [Thermodesulfobacteriota bacterium]|nr:Flp family type IVb pilin [Thermodesulfobacteriota bacterium]
MEKVIRFFKDEEGVTALEYSLIAALIAVIIIGAVSAAGTGVNDTFQLVADKLAEVT